MGPGRRNRPLRSVSRKRAARASICRRQERARPRGAHAGARPTHTQPVKGSARLVVSRASRGRYRKCSSANRGARHRAELWRARRAGPPPGAALPIARQWPARPPARRARPPVPPRPGRRRAHGRGAGGSAPPSRRAIQATNCDNEPQTCVSAIERAVGVHGFRLDHDHPAGYYDSHGY
jgi:hypothetical protein